MRRETGLRLIATFLVFSFLVPAAVAQGFGSFPREKSKTVGDLDANFTLGFINTDNYTKKIILETEADPTLKVDFERNPYLLKPSRISTSPGEGEWYALGGGRYAKVQEVGFTAEIEEQKAEKKKFSIPIEIAASFEEQGGGEGAIQKAFLVQAHVFQLKTTSQAIRPRAEDLYSEESDLLAYDKNDSTSPGENSSYNQSIEENRSSSQVNQYESPEKGLTREDKDQNKAVNRWTLIFLAGAAISTVFLIRELL